MYKRKPYLIGSNSSGQTSPHKQSSLLSKYCSQANPKSFAFFALNLSLRERFRVARNEGDDGKAAGKDEKTGDESAVDHSTSFPGSLFFPRDPGNEVVDHCGHGYSMRRKSVGS